MARQHVPKSIVSPLSALYQVSLSAYRLGAKLRKKKKKPDLYYSSQGAIFYPPPASLCTIKVGKNPVGRRSNSTIVGNL
jgi:hypothetical protein